MAYTIAPLADPELRFEVKDLVGAVIGSPAPQLIRDEYHVFWVYYVDTALAGEMEALCREEGIRRLDDEWYRLGLSEEGWEEQAEALADFFEDCNDRRPYNCGGPMSSWLTLEVGSEEGNRWGGGFYDRDGGTYGLDLEGILEELGRDPEAEPAPDWELPPMEVHYGDKVIIDGDEVIVVNNYEEPEEKTVPFEGTVEGDGWSLGTAKLE